VAVETGDRLMGPRIQENRGLLIRSPDDGLPAAVRAVGQRPALVANNRAPEVRSQTHIWAGSAVATTFLPSGLTVKNPKSWPGPWISLRTRAVATSQIRSLSSPKLPVTSPCPSGLKGQARHVAGVR
jgi:hypothetical protein